MIQAVGLRLVGGVVWVDKAGPSTCVAGCMVDNLGSGLGGCLSRIGDMAGSSTGVAGCMEDNFVGGLGGCSSQIGDMVGRIGDMELNRRRGEF